MEFTQDYCKYNSLQLRDASTFFKKNVNFLKDQFKDKPLRILDIGTGCGKVLHEVVLGESGLNFVDVIGVDKCSELIMQARKNYIIVNIWETLVNSKYKEYKSNINDYFSSLCFNEEATSVVKELLEKIGFKVIFVEYKKHDFDFSPRERFDATTNALNPFIKAMPKKVLKEFNDDLRSIFKLLNEGDKPFNIPYTSIDILAKKI
ncbi:hypothetical protein PVAND_015618 [Polypedilum vanderplanki]|uniref:Methyltransferase domain-containing protein n=1 Tax=Polypedilum vanderplanki TaxID=319348 RepID=A0A9J6BCT0_POLVA|nr:hypothetical protein PVAND_015618 [Polypedilum vanderplanki]